MAAKAFKSLILGGGVAPMFSSHVVHKLSLTAAKPRRILHFAEILLQGTAATRPRHISTIGAETKTNPMEEAFSKYESCVRDLDDKRRKIFYTNIYIKALSRTVMYEVQRIRKHNKDEILKQAEKDLAVIVDQYMSRLVKELQGSYFLTLEQKYSRGIQMYVGAAALCYFCKTGALLHLDEINATLRPLSDPSIELLKISVPDYLIGLANMTKVLPSLALVQRMNGELEFAEETYMFLLQINRKLTGVVFELPDSSDMLMKLDTISEDLKEIEYVLEDSESEIQEE